MSTTVHRYANAGLSVVPIRAGTKRPAVSQWPRLADAPAASSTLERWFGPKSSHGIGLVCGGGGLVAVDMETTAPDPELAWLLELRTPIVRTGRGWHVWLKAETRIGGCRLSPEVELRGHGQVILAPPSTHPSGARYRFARQREFGRVRIAAVPADLLRLLRDDTHVPAHDTHVPGTPRTRYVCGRADRVADERAARDVAALLGLDFPRARCPFHRDRHPSGSFSDAGKHGEWIYRCHRCEETYSLTGLWMRATHGVHPSSVRPPEFARWTARLGIVLGRSVPPDELLPLPAGFTGAARTYWDGYRLLRLCDRLLGSMEEPPYTRNFAARWTGLSETTCQRQRVELLEAGFLERAGTVGAGVRATYRLAPGQPAVDVLAAHGFCGLGTTRKGATGPVRARYAHPDSPLNHAASDPTFGYAIRSPGELEEGRS
jgi:hypothetical protein